MSVQNRYQAAWLIDLLHGSGNVYAATMDLPDHVGTLGQFYKGICKSFGLRVARHLQDGFYGVDIPSLVSGVRFVSRETIGGVTTTHIDASLEWREVSVKIHHYDLATGTKTTVFEGEIVDFDPVAGDVVMSFASTANRVLSVLLPRQLVSADTFSTATDVGAAIPVGYGAATVRPPLIATDGTATASDSGGQDYLISWHGAARVLRVYGEVDRAQAGLEALHAGYAAAPGTPTYATTSTFTVTGGGDLKYMYPLGIPIRFKTTASSGSWVYSHVTAYLLGTVTVAEADLDSGLSNVQLAADYQVSYTRYSIGGTALTSMRVRADISGGLVVEMLDTRGGGTAAMKNPADVLKDILTDTQYGLSQSVDTTDFTTAASALTSAGLGNAVDWGLGWDGRQRRAGDVINSLLALRGGRMTYNAAAGTFSLVVDSAPGAASLTFGYGDGVWNNIKQVVSNARTPASTAVKTLKLRYAPAGRGRDGILTPKDYEYTIGVSALSVGHDRVITSDVIRSHAVAKIVLDYRAKRLQYGDQKPIIIVGQEGRSVNLGDLVRYKNTPDNINADYQVSGIEHSLDSVKLWLTGYDAAIYTDTSSRITTPTDTNRDESQKPLGLGANLLRNPDWSTGTRQATVPTGTADYQSIPGWFIQDTAGLLSSGSVTTDYACIGGHRFAITVTGSDATILSNTPRLTAVNTLADPTGNTSGFACVPGETFFLSVYSDVSSGIRMRVFWLDSGGTLVATHNPNLFMNSADVNGKGWQRRYVHVRAPASSAFCYPEIIFQTAATYQFDAAKFERAGRTDVRPTGWTPNVHFGTDPSQLNPGDLEVRLIDSDPAMKATFTGRYSAATTLSGASTTIKDNTGAVMFPANSVVRAVLTTVSTTITFSGGGTAWNLGTATFPDAWGNGETYLIAGTGTVAGDGAAAGDIPIYADTDLVIAADAGTFATGAVKCVAFLTTYSRPTA